MYWRSLSSGVHAVPSYTKFNVCVVAKTAKGRDAESAKDAEVR